MADLPIDMLIFCPKCTRQHIDEAKPDVCETCGGSQSDCTCQTFTAWVNPPHKSHRCNFCNHVFRPADVPTNGVAAIKTKGERDGDATPQNWIQVVNDLLVKPKSPIADCPADIADDECICGVHAAQNRAINALCWAGEQPPFGVKADEA